MKFVKDDLVEMLKANELDIIVHGCNCFNSIESGIAKTIADSFPIVKLRDNLTQKGSIHKLGTIEVCDTKYGKVVNAYTQYYRGANLDYEALQKCLKQVADYIISTDVTMRVGFPKIGCGIAGGDWNKVSYMIENEFKDLDCTIVYK